MNIGRIVRSRTELRVFFGHTVCIPCPFVYETSCRICFVCLFATVVSFDLGVSTLLWWWIRRSWDRSRFNFLRSNFHRTSFYVICANSPMTPPCSCVISGTGLGSIGMIVSSWINADALMTYHCATWVLNSVLIRLLRSVLPLPLIVVQSAMHVLLSSNFSILLRCSLHRSVYYLCY